MLFDMETLPPQDRYKILASSVVPRPIAWVTTRSRAGVVNAAPFSFF
ncbi:MAG TPA: flavin reductase family protein, partial [Hyphomicrobiaceae bacterium]